MNRCYSSILLAILILFSGCDRPVAEPVMQEATFTLDTPGQGLAISIPTPEHLVLDRDGGSDFQRMLAASDVFHSWYHYPAEQKSWRKVSNDTMYFRDWFVGAESEVTAIADGDTQHAEAILPDGSRILWGKIVFRETHEGRQQCWIASNWIECGSRSLPVLRYVESQCQPAGRWTMRFYHNDEIFHEGSFTFLPQIDRSHITPMSQLDYPGHSYANRCTMPNSKVRHNCDGREGEIELSISRLGCALTSAAMTLTYHGVTVDPPTLNDWLVDNKGYSDGDIDFFKVAEYARAVGGKNIQFLGRVDGADNAALSRSVCRYGPQVIPVWGSGHPPGSQREGLPRGHFVLAGGQPADQKTWLITDPSGGINRTLEGNYGNVHGGSRQFRGPDHEVRDDLNGLVFFLHSPAELLITDPHGRRTGTDPSTGTTYREISDASYGSTGIDDLSEGTSATVSTSKEFYLVRPQDGEYTIRVTGTGTGTYALDFRAYNRRGNLAQVRYDSVVVTPGQVHTYQLLYSSTSEAAYPEVRGGFPGGGQRSDVDQFLSYVSPSQKKITLPAGTTSFDLMITYGEHINPATFQAKLNDNDVSAAFNPKPGTMEIVQLSMVQGRNVLELSIEGLTGKHTATDKDRLTFIVP